MVVGTCRIAVEWPESFSLKEKRGPLRAITSRLRSTFNAAVAEVGDQDAWTSSVLGVAVVSNDARHANEMLSKIVDFIEDNLAEGILNGYEIELVHLDS